MLAAFLTIFGPLFSMSELDGVPKKSAFSYASFSMGVCSVVNVLGPFF